MKFLPPLSQRWKFPLPFSSLHRCGCCFGFFSQMCYPTLYAGFVQALEHFWHEDLIKLSGTLRRRLLISPFYLQVCSLGYLCFLIYFSARMGVSVSSLFRLHNNFFSLITKKKKIFSSQFFRKHLPSLVMICGLFITISSILVFFILCLLAIAFFPWKTFSFDFSLGQGEILEYLNFDIFLAEDEKVGIGFEKSLFRIE